MVRCHFAKSYSHKVTIVLLKLYGDRKIGPETWVLTRLNFAAGKFHKQQNKQTDVRVFLGHAW